MNEYLPIPAKGKLVPYTKKRKNRRALWLLLILAIGAGIFLASQYGVFAALRALFQGEAAEDPSLYEFDRSRLSAGAYAILPVDLSAANSEQTPSEPNKGMTDGFSPLPLPVNGKTKILIINTHPYEAYASEGAYEYSDPAVFTSDKEGTVRLLAEALRQRLEQKGIPAVYVENPATSSRDSYKNADALLLSALADHPDTALVIDLHRAILLAENGDLYRPVTLYEDKRTAQLRLTVGTGDGDEEALRARVGAALTLENALSARCPTLIMPMLLSPSKREQQFPVPLFTVEIGSCGNDVTESTRTASLLGDALALLLDP